MASELRLTTLANNAGTESVDTTYVINGSARAWNNTSADGTTIYNSFNISSLTDHGVGRQKHNVTNSFADVYHAPTFSISANYNQQWTWSMATTQWATANYTGSAYADGVVRTESNGGFA